MHNPMAETPSGQEIGVQMGRFCPYTQGHALITQQLYQDCGDRSLLIVGSQNAFRWPDVPFTATQRIDLIRKSIGYPIEICGLDDSNPHDKRAWDLEKWWASLRQLEVQKGGSFVFYGGSEDDLKYHKQGGFKTHVAVDRLTEGRGIAATEIRNLLGTVLHARAAKNELREIEAITQLSNVLSINAIKPAIEYFDANVRQLSATLRQDLLSLFAPLPPTSHE